MMGEDMVVPGTANTDTKFADEGQSAGRYIHDEPGIYVDAASGEPLFASSARFETCCGWPSFTRPIDPPPLDEHPAWSRLQASFDGPPDKDGLRFRVQRAAMRFIGQVEMQAEGYGAYLDQVDQRRAESSAAQSSCPHCGPSLSSPRSSRPDS